MRLLTVVGARPQFIKAAVVSRAVHKRKNIEEIILHTGQHYDNNMSAVFFEEMNIPEPAYNLDIKEHSHGAMTAKMLDGIEKILLKEKPDLVLVYGDTNSTLAAALAASKLQIPVAHVEAGLRSHNMQMPEEINRILTDRVSNLLFCPTRQSVKNLKKEGFEKDFYRIYETGDVMLDAVKYYFKKSKAGILSKLNIRQNNFILSTFHRAENTDDINNLEKIISALNQLNKEKEVIVPLHPRTAKFIHQHKINTDFRIIKPLGYFDMLQLLSNCSIVITDSGGLQKEACFFKKFCVTLREQTEWTELIKNGYSILAGSNSKKILKYSQGLLSKPFPEMKELYGDGNAGEKIAVIIEKLSDNL